MPGMIHHNLIFYVVSGELIQLHYCLQVSHCHSREAYHVPPTDSTPCSYHRTPCLLVDAACHFSAACFNVEFGHDEDKDMGDLSSSRIPPGYFSATTAICQISVPLTSSSISCFTFYAQDVFRSDYSWVLPSHDDFLSLPNPCV